MQTDKPTSVYIVDDSDTFRQRLVAMLEAIPGVDVVGEARTAPDAIRDILAVQPHSVLLDLNLAEGSGMDVLNAVHRQLPVVSFVVLTNHSEPQYRRACSRAGAEFFLDKSTEFESVRSVIAEIAARSH
jgi:DNA-binding NarL/FixJ family response regulator